MPRFDRDRQGTWLTPPCWIKTRSCWPMTSAASTASSSRRIRSLAWWVRPRRLLDERIIAGPVSTGSAVIVATADRRVRSLAARDLSPVGSWELDAPLADRLVGSGEGCFVMDRAGGVMAFGAMASDPGRSSSDPRSSAPPWSGINRLVRHERRHAPRRASPMAAHATHAARGLAEGRPAHGGHAALVASGRGTIRTLVAEPGAGIDP